MRVPAVRAAPSMVYRVERCTCGHADCATIFLVAECELGGSIVIGLTPGEAAQIADDLSTIVATMERPASIGSGARH